MLPVLHALAGRTMGRLLAMHTIGIVLHPQRDSAEAVEAILGWAASNGAEILGIRDGKLAVIAVQSARGPLPVITSMFCR